MKITVGPDQARNAGEVGVAQVEHPARQTGIRVQAHHRGLARDDGVTGGDADRARLVQGKDVLRIRPRERGQEGGPGRAGVAEHGLDLVGGDGVLDELGTRSRGRPGESVPQHGWGR